MKAEIKKPGRVLSFPADPIPGQVRVMGEGAPAEPQPLQGDIEVPEGCQVMLQVGSDDSPTPVDLSVLEALATDDVQNLHVHNFVQESLPALSHLSGVVVLNLAAKGVLSASLAPLAGMGSLRMLMIGADEISADALAGLSGLDEVSYVLIRAKLTGDALRAIPAMGAESLVLMGVDASVDELIEVARRQPNLKGLGVRGADGQSVLDKESQVRIWKELPEVSINGTWYAPSTVEAGVKAASIVTSGDGSVKPIDLTVDTWDEAIASETPVLVDFWAEWCGPCKAIAPTIEKLAGELAGRVTVAKVDVDSNKEISERYGIRGIPALYVFREDELVAKIGSQDREGILEQLGPVLA